MTNYNRTNEKYRNDVDLKAAIANELILHAKDLKLVINLMQVSYETLLETPHIDERESYVTPIGVQQTRRDLISGLHRLKWKLDFLTNKVTDSYLGDIATGMTADEVKQLKEKYTE